MTTNKVITENIHLKDTELLEFGISTTGLSSAASYIAQKSTTQSSNEEYNIKKKIYHSQVLSHLGTATHVIPLIDITPTTNSQEIEFGKIVLKIKFIVDTSSATNLFEIVGTAQAASAGPTADIIETSSLTTQTASANLIGPNAGIYNSGIIIAGETAGTIKTYIIDFDTQLKGPANAADGDRICIGLKLLTTTSTKTAIESHIEVVESNDSYITAYNSF